MGESSGRRQIETRQAGSGAGFCKRTVRGENLARKHTITKDQALKIIKDTKGNRVKANAAAEKLK